MKRIITVTAAIGIFLIMGVSGRAADQPGPAKQAERPADGDSLRITLRIPLASDIFSDCVIARVNEDTISIEDLNNAMVSAHQDKMEQEGAGKAGGGHEDAAKTRIDFSEPLKRLINAKLVVQEAQNVGLDELPEFKKEIEVFSDAALRQVLMKELSKDVAVDDKDVENTYTEMVREWKIKSILFDKEQNAKKALKAIKAGEKFDAVAGKALKAGTAKGSGQGQFVKPSGLSRDVLQALTRMKVGSTSPIIRVNDEKGFTLINLEDVRIPESAAEREKARSIALTMKKNNAVKQYRDALFRKNVTLDKKLFKALDYESPRPGIDKLLEDRRVLAKISGEKPLLVKDLSAALKEKFFHGLEGAAKDKRINAMKQEVLDSIIGKRLLRKEALRRGIDKSKSYEKLVRDKEESLLFGLFMQKIVIPKVKFNDDDLNAYYRGHLADYTYPGMIKIDGLTFDKLKDAESALAKLKKNADFTWVRENAEGQTAKDAEDLYIAGESIVLLNTLPGEMQKALTGAKAGDFRLATGDDGRYYVISVLELIPERQQALEQVVEAVAEKVFETKLNAAVEEWFSKLRKAADIDVYLQTATTKAY